MWETFALDTIHVTEFSHALACAPEAQQTADPFLQYEYYGYRKLLKFYL
jgi:hypothetical protein